MDLHVDLQERRDVAGQIYRGLRARILDGRLRDGEQVPPSRELAQRLGVSRNTVGVAYEWLSAEGLLVGRGRAGSFVQNAPRERGAREATARGVKLRPRTVWSELRVPPSAEPPAPYDFRVGIPDTALFTFEAWHRLLARHLRVAATTAAYTDPAGHPELREAVARHVGVSRRVRAEASDVLITHGAQQALDLAGRVLLEPGDRVAVEEPGYPPARLLFQSLGARVVPVPVDAEGIDVQALPDDTRLVYVTPSHQFPLGIVMSPARRRALLDWARRRSRDSSTRAHWPGTCERRGANTSSGTRGCRRSSATTSETPSSNCPPSPAFICASPSREAAPGWSGNSRGEPVTRASASKRSPGTSPGHPPAMAGC
ncbi:PLP-dependent aminotransferase family protein [Myxococcus sp. AM010]|uniref:aminotransferase-like domain-containing protein n=1 Tax=Myxococcus sp. AM010 TaxID=2745138 RepID=UPI0038B2A1E4